MDTIEERPGSVDYQEAGAGPTIVLAPGSCSTGAAWRGVVAAWQGRFRCVTTSLLGYGGTEERRLPHDIGIAREAEAIEAVIRRAGGPVHLVGHSFGGLVGLAVALRDQVELASLTILEAPAPEMLRAAGEYRHYDAIRRMTHVYLSDVAAGNPAAIATLIDFFGGEGAFAAWPLRARLHAILTTPTNMMDWRTAYDFRLSAQALAVIDVPTLVMWGGESHPAMRRANELLGEHIPGATSAELAGIAHFMIATHPPIVADLIARHVDVAETRWRTKTW
jgi:pimeloyl-ACP methyl ester carboxylesterase